MVVTEAARAGAQYGSFSTTNAVDSAGMISRANAVLAANGLGTGAAPTAQLTCTCLADNATVVGAASVACNTVCVASHLTASVSVTVSRTFSLINPFPGLPNNFTVSRTATMRVAQ